MNVDRNINKLHRKEIVKHIAVEMKITSSKPSLPNEYLFNSCTQNKRKENWNNRNVVLKIMLTEIEKRVWN